MFILQGSPFLVNQIDPLLSRTALSSRRPGARVLAAPWINGASLLLLSLVLLLFGARIATPHMRVDIGAADDMRALVRFHEVEYNVTGPYRWSEPLTAVFLYGFDGQTALVTLTLAAPRPTDVEPALTTVESQNRVLASLQPNENWRRYQLLVPTHPIGDTSLTLTTPPFEPGGEDTRRLGVAFRQVEASAIGGTFPSIERIFFLLSLPLIAWLALWRGGAGQPLAIGVGVTLAGGVGWVAANPVAGGYVLPTILWPWWPIIPLAGLAALPAIRRAIESSAEWLARRRDLWLWGGSGLALLALIALRSGFDRAWGLTILAVGVALAMVGLFAKYRLDIPSLAKTDAPSSISLRFEVLALLGITALALTLRFYHLDTLPAGLWRDESRHGLLALRIWQDPSFRPVYVVQGADLPALLFYLMAPFVGIFGPHAWSARLVSALAGGLTPLALWWAARPLLGARAAVIGAALIAWASWGLSMSRWAFPATLDHLLTLTAAGLMWRALTPIVENDRSYGSARSFIAMALAGLCAGLAAYAYHTGRLAPVTLAALTSIRLGLSWSNWRRALPALITAALVGLLTLTPLLNFIAADYAGYSRRVSQVTIFNSVETDIHAPLALLMRNIGRYLGMWHISGELNGRHHAPEAPMIDPLAGLLFLFGLIATARYWRKPALFALLLWLVLGHIPGLFSTEAPHAMRSLGALAPAAMIAGLGLNVLANRTARQQPWLANTLLGSMLALSLAFNVWLYFGQMAHDPRVYNEFDLVETAMARVARAPHDADTPEMRAVHVFLPPWAAESDTVRFLTDGVDLAFFDGATPTTSVETQALILLPPDADAAGRSAALRALGPEATQFDNVPAAPDGEPLFLAYGVGEYAAQLLHADFDR